MSVRLAVIGAGHMGCHHARKVAELAAQDGGVRLAAVVDLVEERAREAAGPGVQAATDLRAVLGSVDAAIVAVPSQVVAIHYLGVSGVPWGLLFIEVTCRLLPGIAYYRAWIGGRV